MGSKIKKSMEVENNVQLEISEQQPRDNGLEHWGSAMLVPGEWTYTTPTGNKGGRGDPSGDSAPEKKLTLFALRLAVLEKVASGLGALGFIWATVVLLGGFAVTLERKDFWFVTVILLIEGTRIYSRSHELEWQHRSTKTPAGRYSFRRLVSSSRSFLRAIKSIFHPAQSAGSTSRGLSDDIQMTQKQETQPLQNTNKLTKRTWRSSEVPLFPYVGWVFISRNVSRVLFWLQLLSATACVALSLMRLIEQDYGKVTNSDCDNDKKNRGPALNIFYALALAEALTFLLEKAYWEWKVSYGKLLEKVQRDCDIVDLGIIPIKRFFYDAYSSCISGSIFDGLKMDMITFAEELLDSDSFDEQLIGARILQKFVINPKFAHDTLRKIGTSTAVMERLIEMLNWKNPVEQDIRMSAAVIISKLAGRKQNALRVAGITGAIESVSSLLYSSRSSDAKPHELSSKVVVADQMDYEYSAFNLLGTSILKKLARDHDNCGKIGSTRGLLAKIIDSTNASQNLLRNALAPDSQIKAVRRSLQLVRMLVSATGSTGKMLRTSISEIVFTVSNIREILQYGESHMVLQKLGIEILTSLAMDEDAKEKIADTGGVIKMLLLIFFKPGLTEDQNSVSVEAGEALAILALESRRNCARILKERRVVERLVGALNEPVLRKNSSRILRNLCAYSDTECFNRLKGVSAAIPTVLKAIMVESDKLLEVSVGLASQFFRFLSVDEYDKELMGAGIKDSDFAEKLVCILKAYDCPEIKVPRIRLFVIEVAIHMMKSQEKYIQLFKDFGMEEMLENVAETTSELENFNVFSGSVGISRHKTTLTSLVDTAIELMNEGLNQHEVYTG